MTGTTSLAIPPTLPVQNDANRHTPLGVGRKPGHAHTWESQQSRREADEGVPSQETTGGGRGFRTLDVNPPEEGLRPEWSDPHLWDGETQGRGFV